MPEIRIKTLNRWRRVLLYPLWLLVRLWGRTLRFEVTPEDEARFRDTSSPTIALLWHNRLFLAAAMYQRYRRPRPMYGLVSASKDGAWLSAFFNLAGLRTVRGSSSRRGRDAFYDLGARLMEGHDVSITPDGPRGPAYSFKPGAAMLILRTQVKVLLFGSSFTSAWRVNSWDRFFLPRPFSKVRIVCRVIHAADLPADFQECAEVLRTGLAELNED